MWLRYGSLLFAIPCIALLTAYGIELSAITECQQQQLHYHYDSGQCVADAQPFTTYYMRHAVLVNSTMLLALLGSLAMTWGMIDKKRQQALASSETH